MGVVVEVVGLRLKEGLAKTQKFVGLWERKDLTRFGASLT